MNTFKNFHIADAEVGVRVDGGQNVAFEGATFDNVETPYQIDTTGDVRITGTRMTNDPAARSSARVGWRKLPGPALPSYCEHCGNIFPSAKYQMAGPYFYLWDNEDICIVCGNEHAKLSQGHFDLASETIKILRASDITKAMVSRLHTLGVGVAFGKLKPDDAADQATMVHPSFGGLIKKWKKWGVPAFIFFNAVTAAVVTNWDLAERIGVMDSDTITIKMLKSALAEHETNWEKRFQYMQGQNVSDDVPHKLEMKKRAAPANEKTVRLPAKPK